MLTGRCLQHNLSVLLNCLTEARIANIILLIGWALHVIICSEEMIKARESECLPQVAEFNAACREIVINRVSI